MCRKTPDLCTLNSRAQRKRMRLDFPGKTPAQTVKTTIVIRVLYLILENLQQDSVKTTRDLYYQDVKLFGNQNRVSRTIEQICSILHVHRRQLNIIPAQSGLIVGDIRVDFEHRQFEVSRSNGPALIPVGDEISRIELLQRVDYVLIVEKEAVFTHLHTNLTNAILIIGKGYPDHYTRKFVSVLAREYPEIPFYALVDSDVHGLQIFHTYKDSGQRTLEFHYPIKKLRYLGVCILDYNEEWITISSYERRLLASVLKKDWISQDECRTEAQRLLFMGCKAEMNLLDRQATGRLASYVQTKIDQINIDPDLCHGSFQ